MSSTPAQPRWTLDQLASRVASSLEKDYDGQSSGRVTEVPNARTLRYYTTLGLLDRPAEMRGRTAYYAPRHLSQIIAIKRLQARGLTLAEVQARLLGMADAELHQLARIPPQAWAGEALPSIPSGQAAAPGDATRGGFWRTPAAAVAPQTEAPLPALNPRLPDLQGVVLGAVTLLLTPARPLDGPDLEALRVAAAPLLNLLETRGLLRPSNKEKP